MKIRDRLCPACVPQPSQSSGLMIKHSFLCASITNPDLDKVILLFMLKDFILFLLSV